MTAALRWAAALLLAAAPLAALQVPAPRAASLPFRKVALVLEKGSTARHQLVAIGRDVVVAGEALSDVAALQGSIEVSGRVAGDVIVLGGSARLTPSAAVDGDVYALGGMIDAAPGARIGGRSVSYPTASSAWLTLMEGPAIGLSATSPLVLGAKVALLAAWAALLLLFFAVSGREVLSTAENVRREPFRSFFVGLTGVLAILLTALFLSAFAGALIGVPLLVLVVLLAIVLKLWGMIAVFYALGDWLALHLVHRRIRPLTAATWGLLLLGALKFIPWIGLWSWTAASFIGVGAALSTKFGRREPWFDLETA
ncbi:MAG TPA: polymer-forming cytoskeletal protein [Thermoanaerobaculia bacterium]